MHVLVIDDEPAVRQILAAAVRKAGHAVDTAATVSEAASKLVRGDADVALCDIHLPDGNGLDLVKSIRESGSDTQFIMVTAFASVETAVEALKAGAADYIIKPANIEELLHKLATIEAVRGLKAENRALRQIVSRQDAKRFVFRSPQMAEVTRLVHKVAPTEATVLITGESGTGKGVTARQIHEASQRAAQVFLPVNCGAIPENLIESELFGHVKGAFTGADRPRKGLFQQADGGTIFLDEIGELPLHLQVKLLHVLEEKAVRPVGSEEHKPVDVRIIAATNRDLEAMVREGKFREDLFFRLSIFRLALPPLRERPSDIGDLIEHFASVWHRETGRTAVFDEAAKQALQAYAWPGNVRQLDNLISRVLLLADSDRITLADIPSDILGRRAPAPRDAGAMPAPAESGSLRERMRQHEARLIADALRQAGGDKRQAATLLGIGLSSLYRKIDELNDVGLFGER
jgi:DNA-binding NtrC family response regulator